METFSVFVAYVGFSVIVLTLIAGLSCAVFYMQERLLETQEKTFDAVRELERRRLGERLFMDKHWLSDECKDKNIIIVVEAISEILRQGKIVCGDNLREKFRDIKSKL